MRKIAALLIFLWPFLSNACAIIDDSGHLLQLSQPAQRIISLAPDLTENLFALGAGKSIVGVVKGSDYPKAALRIPIVATYRSLDKEKILALKPDLIVTWADVSFLPALKTLPIPLYISKTRTLADIPQTLQRLGCLTGQVNQSQILIKKFWQDYQFLKNRYQRQQKISVFYVVWSHPLMTITQKNWISDLLQLCGGKNIFAELQGNAPIVSIEAVLMENPAVILSGRYNTYDWHRWPNLRAVQTHAIYTVNEDLIARASVRVLKGAEEVCKVMAKHRSTAKGE